LVSLIGHDELVIASVRLTPQGALAATREALYLAWNGGQERVPWHLVSKARLEAGTLSITVADEVGTLPSGAVLLRDRGSVAVRPERRNRVTDVVHSRVRGSVVASQRVTAPRAAGWVVLRSVAGRDGLVVQMRLDRGSDSNASGLDALVVATADRLRVTTGRVPLEE
jgi:hypothetical protein